MVAIIKDMNRYLIFIIVEPPVFIVKTFAFSWPCILTAPVEAVLAVSLEFPVVTAFTVFPVIAVVLFFAAFPDIPVFTDIPVNWVQFMAVEGETADVGLFVLFGLFKALLEFPFFLETVLLGHLPFLLVGLHDTAVMTEILQSSVKHLVSAELTFQTAVIEGNLDAGFQADLLKALFTIGEDPGIVAFELMFQSFANHLVGA
jgi:hypothetical protein